MVVEDRPGDPERTLSIWDLRDGRLQLRTRSSDPGRLVSVRIAGVRATAPFALRAEGSLARDCALADEVRRML